MKLLSTTVELAKEVKTEAVRESTEIAEDLNEIGKAADEVTTEQMRFGKLTIDEYEKQVDPDSEETLDHAVAAEEYDVLLEPQLSFQGLAACNWKCINSYCYPPDLAKKISTKNPHSPNSKIGHS